MTLEFSFTSQQGNMWDELTKSARESNSRQTSVVSLMMERGGHSSAQHCEGLGVHPGSPHPQSIALWPTLRPRGVGFEPRQSDS